SAARKRLSTPTASRLAFSDSSCAKSLHSSTVASSRRVAWEISLSGSSRLDPFLASIMGFLHVEEGQQAESVHDALDPRGDVEQHEDHRALLGGDHRGREEAD